MKMLDKIKGNPVFTTSISGVNAIKPIIEEIQQKIPDKHVKLAVIKNDFFGKDVTVTGLLSWQDIKRQLSLNNSEYPIFSSAIFNFEMKTIDDVHFDEINEYFGKQAKIINELFIGGLYE
jgi:hypothetical protein